MLPSTIYMLVDAKVVPLRVSVLTVWIGYVVGGVILVFYVLPFLQHKTIIPLSMFVNTMPILMEIIQLVFSPSLSAGINDVVAGRISAFEKETEQRESIIRKCFTDTCIILPLSYHPVWLDPYPLEAHHVNLENYSKSKGKRILIQYNP